MTVYDSGVELRRVLLRRLLAGLVLLALAFLVDRHACAVLKALLFYDTVRYGEVREALLTARFLASGLGVLLIGLAVGTLGRRGWRRAGVLWLVVAAATLTGSAVKLATGRERPSHLDQPIGQERMGFAGPAGALGHSTYQSFPSGHTLSAFAAATCLAAFYPPARVAFYLVAGACGVNRVVQHQHFASDVVAGALLGHLMALWLLSRPALRRQWRDDSVDSPGA
jgi:membrane-associated phospholipid phosphatase